MPETDKHLLKVFLCHASQDKPSVRELSQRLFAEGWIDPWVDEKKLLPGHDWRTKIEEAVETSDIVIICLSSNSVSKEGFVQKELRYAREISFEKPDETIFLIPLRLDDCTVPRGLRFYQWADYFGEDKEETYNALLEALKLRYEQKLKHEAEERARKEKAERERIALEEKVRKEAKEKARLEAEERAQREREEQERKVAETQARKEAKDIARKEAEERARIEKEEKERKAAEIALQEKKKRELVEKTKRERAERQAAQIAVLKETLSKSFVSLKSILPKAIPFLRLAGLVGIAVSLFWVGSWGIPKLISLVPTAKASLIPTVQPSPRVTFIVSSLPPTKTLTPSDLISTPTSTPVLNDYCNYSVFVSDVTIPDNTIMLPGVDFTKIWRIKNTGYCTWLQTYMLAFVGGDLMSGQNLALTNPIAAGESVDLSINLTAPSSAGLYQGSWRLKNTNGFYFGAILTVIIKVP